MKLFRYLALGIALLSIGWITPNPNAPDALVASRDILPASADTHSVGTPDNIFEGGYFRFIDLAETGKPEKSTASRDQIFASTDGHIYLINDLGTSRQFGKVGTTLLHFNDTFLDSASSDRIFSASGGTRINTEASIDKFGTGVASLDGVGDYLSTGDSPDWNFGTGDFAIDFWFKLAGGDGSRVRFMGQLDGASYWELYKDENNKWGFTFVQSGVGTIGAFLQTTAWTYDTNWHHLVFARSGATPYLFIDGVSKPLMKISDFGTFPDLSSDLYIGQLASNQYVNGWIDELRISKGVARWTSDFTPPTKEY